MVINVKRGVFMNCGSIRTFMNVVILVILKALIFINMAMSVKLPGCIYIQYVFLNEKVFEINFVPLLMCERILFCQPFDS